ncbi:MAG: sugar ABC transporter substrate-binding protein [Candidatus Sumerlaeota bacterium]|nr:sugar ABC transporter substrate-binding protein [Candidatus Sumerlaeota bacterium]
MICRRHIIVPLSVPRITRGILHGLGALIFTFILSACLDSTRAPEMKFASWGTSKDVAIYRNLIAMHHRDHPADPPVTMLFIPWGNYFTKLQLLIVGNVAPGMATVSVEMAYSLQSAGHLRNLQPFIERERQTNPGFLRESDYIIDPLNPMCEFDGDTYYIPCGPMTMNLFYNKDLFDKAGIPYPDETWTWGDLRKAAKTLTVRDPDGRIAQWGFMCENWWNWWAPFLWQNEADLFDDMSSPTRCLLAAPNAIETFRFFQTMIFDDRSAPTPVQAATMSGNFMTGKLAMQIHGSWMIEQFRNIKAFKWDMSWLPRQKKRANIVTVGGYAITSQCRDPQAAWRFLRQFCTDEGQQALCNDCALWMPNKRSVLASDPFRRVTGLPAHHDIRIAELQAARPGMIRHPRSKEIVHMLGMKIDPIFNKNQDVGQTMRELVPVIDRMLAGKSLIDTEGR